MSSAINNSNSIESNSKLVPIIAQDKKRRQSRGGSPFQKLEKKGTVTFAFNDADIKQEEKQVQQLDGNYKHKFSSVVDEYQEMIAFLDFSFEHAFDKKEKEFMLAYRAHIETVQQEINNLKNEANEQKYLSMKQEKIKMLELKLRKIRGSAMFLGDMSEKHKKTLKEYKLKVDEHEHDKMFLEKQIEKARLTNKEVKEQLNNASQEYESVYEKAQKYIKNCKDQDKINQLLALLDDNQRQAILDEQQEKLAMKEQNDPNRTVMKYQNTKLQNFVQTLQDMEMSKNQFANEIERYFFYHSLRKTNVQKGIEDQFNNQKSKRSRIANNQSEQSILIQKSKMSELYKIFVQHITFMREELRQRKTLNKLKNLKSLKVRTDQIEIPDISSITIAKFKPNDKKILMERFLADPRVQTLVAKIMANRPQSQSYTYKQTRPSTTNTTHYLNSNTYDRIMNEPIEHLINNAYNTQGPQRRDLVNAYHQSRLYSSSGNRPQMIINNPNAGIIKSRQSFCSQTSAEQHRKRPQSSNQFGIRPKFSANKYGSIDRPITAANY